MRKRDLLLAIGGVTGGLIAAKFLMRPATVRWQDVADVLPHSDHSHFVSVDGMRLHFQEFGNISRPTLLLIHGYTASSYVWKTVAPMLADSGFHVIAIDLVGFGFSDKPRSFDYSIQSQARVISRFMNRLGIGQATIVGSSYGGAVAATLALDYAQRVEKLVLVDAVTNDRLRDRPILRLAAVRGLGEVLTPFYADSRRILRRRMQGTLARANHDLITRERIESVLRPLRAADGHHSLLQTSRNWRAQRVEDDAHLIRQRTLIIWGEEDTVTPLEDGRAVHSAILQSRLVVLKDCGHVPMEEKPHIFNHLVTEFARGDEPAITGIRHI